MCPENEMPLKGSFDMIYTKVIGFFMAKRNRSCLNVH